MDPVVSIITAVRDGARTIAETIASVQAQTEPRWEHLIIDDGSTDATATLVRSTAEPRRRYVRQDPAGRSAARNRGLELVRGELVLFLDADDWLLPEALALHLALFAAHPEIGASLSDGLFCTDDGAPITTFSARRAALASGDVLPALVSNPGLVGAPLAVMVRLDALRRHGIRFDPALAIGEDARLFIELARHVRFGVLDAVTCRYRWHPGNTTRRADPAAYRCALWRALSDVPDLPEFATLPAAVRERFFYVALVELLVDRAEAQAAVIASTPFTQLPADARARLLRLAASEHLLADRAAAAAPLLARAGELAPRDPLLAALRGLSAVHPRLARLVLRLRRAGRARRADPLGDEPGDA